MRISETIVVLTFLLFVTSAFEYQDMPSGIENYSPKLQHLSLQQVYKLQNETVMHLYKQIGLEISSKFYFVKGNVSDQDLYNPAAYKTRQDINKDSPNSTQDQVPCEVYPTSFYISQFYRTILLNSPQNDPFFLPAPLHSQRQVDGQLVAGYVFINTDSLTQIQLYRVTYQKKQNANFLASNFKNAKIQKRENIKINETKLNSIYRKYFQFFQNCLIVNSESIYLFKYHDESLTKLEGYTALSEMTRSAEVMEVRSLNNTLFYVANQKSLEVYSYTDKVTKLWDYSEFIQSEQISFIKSAVYNPAQKYFYVTTDRLLYVLEGDQEKMSNTTTIIKVYKINGTCTFRGQFHSTMHLMCYYKKINYGMEVFFSGQNITLNRFYTDWDLDGIRDIINIGNDKMVIVGDQKFLVQNYAINRQILLDLGKYQPYTVFPFIDGEYLRAIPTLSTKFTTAMISIAEHSISLRIINQEPPQLYCKFSEHGESADTYSVLAVFNTSDCDLQKGQNSRPDFVGSLQKYCQIRAPIRIFNQDKPIETKQANLLSGSIILLLVIGSILLIGSAVLIAKKIVKQRETLRKKWNDVQNKKISKYETQMQKT